MDYYERIQKKPSQLHQKQVGLSLFSLCFKKLNNFIIKDYFFFVFPHLGLFFLLQDMFFTHF